MEIENVNLDIEVQRLLKDLVAIPSVNPSFHKEGQPENWFGEKRLADFIMAWGRAEGIDGTLRAVLNERPNVLLRVEGNQPGHLVWEAHMDTVQVDDMTIDPFAGEVREGRLFGRGACDTKGSLCAMLLALRYLAHVKSRPTVTLAATMDEEYRYRGVLGLIDDDLRFNAGVVGEPTNLQLVIAHKGCVRFSIETQGRAVHTSRAEEGINAIEHMAWVITELRRRLDPLYAQRTHPLVGCPTLTTSLISGGTGINTVPHHCTIQVDRRLNPGEDATDALLEIRGIVDEIMSVHPTLRVKVHDPFVTDIPMEIPSDAPIVRAMQAGAGEQGKTFDVVGVPYGSDASKLVRAGIPTVVFGPGSIDDAHTARESVRVADVSTAARRLLAGAVAFAEKGGEAGRVAG